MRHEIAWIGDVRRCDNAHVTSDVEIYEPSPADWRMVRDVRLRALKDAPDAFGSTYAREVAFTQVDWTRRLADAENATFLARLGERTVGIVGGWQDGAGVELVAMWVDPTARGHGVAEPLVNAVLRWAADIGEERVHLWVTDGNDSAYRLYERCGFVATTEHQPLPSNPELTEIGMVRTLSP